MPTKRRSSTARVSAYTDPRTPGGLGGVDRYARAQELTRNEALQELRQQLAYMLHRPVRRRFRTLFVLVFHVDEQWVADIVEMQPLKKLNRGTRYLLTVIDVLSKYAWVPPLKSKTGKAVMTAFQFILRRSGGRRPLRLQTDKEK